MLHKLNRLGNSVDALIKQKELEKQELDKKKFEGVTCEITPPLHHHGIGKLEFINNTHFEIRVLKVSAEFFFDALIKPNYSYPDHPSKDYKHPTPNPSDKIIIRKISPGGSGSVQRVMFRNQKNSEIWMKVQISLVGEENETFPLKLIRVVLKRN